MTCLYTTTAGCRGSWAPGMEGGFQDSAAPRGCLGGQRTGRVHPAKMRLSNAGRSVRDVQAWPSGHLGGSTSRCRFENLMPGCRRLCEGIEMFLVEGRPLPVVHHTLETSQGALTLTASPQTRRNCFSWRLPLPVTRGGGCLGQDALKLCTELGFALAGGRPTRQTTAQAPPRGCCRQGAVARSQARNCCRGCGIDRCNLEHVGDGMAGTRRMGLLEQRRRHRPSSPFFRLVLFRKKRCISGKCAAAESGVMCPEPHRPHFCGSMNGQGSVERIFPHSPEWK